jgi:hypothetical protein
MGVKMKFIKLTVIDEKDETEHETYISVDKICFFNCSTFKKGVTHLAITGFSKHGHVKETPEEILDLIYEDKIEKEKVCGQNQLEKQNIIYKAMK